MFGRLPVSRRALVHILYCMYDYRYLITIPHIFNPALALSYTLCGIELYYFYSICTCGAA